MTESSTFYQEMDIIQRCLVRMADNSFRLKLMAVILFGAFIVTNFIGSLFLPILPIFLFWVLDAYFLRLERMYRKMADWLVDVRFLQGDAEAHLYDFNPNRFADKVAPIFEVMLSNTLFSFYGLLLAICIAYLIIAA